MAFTDSYIDRTIYDSLGHTGNTYYYRAVRKADGRIWDNINGELADNPNWEDSAISLTETGTTGQFDVVIPENFPRGTFDIIVYIQTGSAPQNTDDVELQYDTTVGGILGF